MNLKIIRILSFFSLALWLTLGAWFALDSQRASYYIERVSKIAIGDYSVTTMSDFLNILKRGAVYKLSEEKIPSIFLDVKYTDLLVLENQRKNININKEYVGAILSVQEHDQEKESFKVKVRNKGDREMHRLNISEMSMKLDIKGPKRLFGMEEFSIQKAIVRNYTWETLLHLTIKSENVLALRQIPIRFYRNGVDLGIFFIEEGFGKELIESQGRKLGPIIGIEEDFGVTFPNISYSVYDDKKLIETMPGVYNYAKEKLRNLKKNFNTAEYKVEDDFDLDIWAKFFAMADLFESYHGTVVKSVKLYYNPSSALFEPILFDGHVGAGEFNNFILLDFLSSNTPDCEWICNQKDWYMIFYKNPKFLARYYHWLKEYSSDYFIEGILKTIDQKIEPINNAIYSELSLADNIFYKGMLPFYFNSNRLVRRAMLIRQKLEEVGDIVSIINGNFYIGSIECNLNNNANYLILNENGLDSTPCEKIIKQSDNVRSYRQLFDKSHIIDLVKCTKGCRFSGNGDVVIDSGLWFVSDLNLEDTNIKFSNNSNLVMIGNTEIIGNSKEITFEGSGSVTQIGGTVKMSGVKFDSLISPSVRGVNWSGAVNIINSNAFLDNVVISNNKSEDAINLVNSDTKIKNIRILNSFSDGLDVDFGNIVFENIYCENIGNDCLDTSGSNVNGIMLQGTGVEDKLISFGEESTGKIDEVRASNVDIVVVSKDAASLVIGVLDARKYKVLAAAFTKKNFFGAATLSINDCNSCLENNPVVLNGIGSTINIESVEITSILASNDVQLLMYGGEYGKATVKQ